jgi:hypothetical protein
MMESVRPSIKERKEELKIRAQELDLYQKTLELQDKQTTALFEQLRELKAAQRRDLIREALLANALNFLTGDVTQDPQRDFRKAMTTYLEAVNTLDTLEGR